MVGEWVGIGVSLVGFIFVLGLMIESRIRLNNAVLDIEEQLQMMERALDVVAGVLQQIPEMVPQFSINQNPLGQLLEFIQGLKGEGTTPYSGAQLRGDKGQFKDGEKEEDGQAS
jgi:hypothetical protein